MPWKTQKHNDDDHQPSWRDSLPRTCVHPHGIRMEFTPNQCAECRTAAGEPPRRNTNPLTLTDEQRDEYREIAEWGRALVRDTLRRHYRDDHTNCEHR